MARNDYGNNNGNNGNNNAYNQESVVTSFAGNAAGAGFDPGLTMPPESYGFGTTPDRKNPLDEDGFVTTPDPSADNYGNTEIIDEREDITGEKIRPVVGWVVCVAGGAMGKDFRLHDGFNYIGRYDELEVSIKDKKIDREASVQIVFDRESRNFYIAKCGNPKAVSRVNKTPLIGDRELKAGDRIKMGDTELVFVPFCGESFIWPEEENDEENSDK